MDKWSKIIKETCDEMDRRNLEKVYETAKMWTYLRKKRKKVKVDLSLDNNKDLDATDEEVEDEGKGAE